MKSETKKAGKSKEIIEDILKRIENGKVKIGDKLPSERDLAKMYNVSRIVIREVISYLKAINVVESVQGSGNYVKRYYENSFGLSLPDYDIDDIIESRKILEKSIAFSVFKYLDEKMINEMEKICENLSKAINTKDLESSLVQDFKFHQLYAKYSKNPVIENFLEYLTSFIQQKFWRVMREEYLFTNTYNKKTLENHRNILRALKERDLNKLLLYIELHYETIIEGLKK